MQWHNEYMAVALDLARLGLGRTSPNPAVGAVLVKNGKVVGTGFHKKAGLPHAEVEALRGRSGQAQGATLYVTLEPCCHQGRTPPCTDAILKSGVREVVVGMKDPDPRVAGQGIALLRKGGLRVRVNVLRKECEDLNEAYIKHRTTGMPLVILKVGATLDGMIATRTGESRWITGEKARLQAHHLRDRVDAILVGANTIMRDNPRLTTRIPGHKSHQPARIILDSTLYVDGEARVFQDTKKAPTWIATVTHEHDPKVAVFRKRGVGFVFCRSQEGRVDLGDLLLKLGSKGVLSLLVEGGPTVHSAFLKAGLADRMVMFVAPRFLGESGLPMFSGIKVSRLEETPRLENVHYRSVGDDLMVEGRFVR